MLFRQGSEKCQVIDAIGNLGLLPHWPAYIPMVRLRYPTKMKLATRSAMRNNRLRMDIWDFRSRNLVVLCRMGRHLKERGNVANYLIGFLQ